MYPKELLDRKPRYDTPEWHEWKEECRKVLEERTGGQVWDTDELTRDFNIEGFMAPLCFGKRRSDNVKVSLLFTVSPRFYYGVEEG